MSISPSDNLYPIAVLMYDTMGLFMEAFENATFHLVSFRSSSYHG